MKKIDVLIWGMHHIGANHNSKSHIVDYKPECWSIYTGNSVPAMADVQMLCESMGIERKQVVVIGFTVEVRLPKDWPDTIGQEEYVTNPATDMWHRYGVKPGDPLGYFTEEYDPFYERGVGKENFFMLEQEAKEWCEKKCAHDHNGNIYYIGEVGKDWRTPHIYVCQWSTKEQKVVDITEEENNRYNLSED